MVDIPINPVFAKALASAQQKFGADNVYVADEHSKHIFGFDCPIAWGYMTGGTDKIPLRRVIGCDAPSGYFKSCLMMEHGRLALRSGCLLAIIDTEEKVSDTLVCSMLFREHPNVRLNYAYAKAGSVEQAQEYIMHFKSMAKQQVEDNADPAKRAPWFVVWDSLTGRDTKDAQSKIEKEGSAAVRAYADAAGSIARFYKNFSFGDELLTLAHVQHVGRNMDADARGDDEWKPKGGDEPKYAATYHFRITNVSDIQSAEWQGKELTIKCVKSGLGPDKRRIRARVLWKFVWVDLPQFTDDEERTVISNDAASMTYDEAEAYYEWTQQALSGRDAYVLRDFLQLDKPPKEDKRDQPHCQWPVTERIRFQQTWWDWDWALGNLLVHGIKYNDKTFAQDKKDLDEALHFVKGTNKNSVKCEELWGDSETRTLEEFGAAIDANPDIRRRIQTFLGITRYKHFREVKLGEVSKARSGNRKKKTDG